MVLKNYVFVMKHVRCDWHVPIFCTFEPLEQQLLKSWVARSKSNHVIYAKTFNLQLNSLAITATTKHRVPPQQPFKVLLEKSFLKDYVAQTDPRRTYKGGTLPWPFFTLVLAGPLPLFIRSRRDNHHPPSKVRHFYTYSLCEMSSFL